MSRPTRRRPARSGRRRWRPRRRVTGCLLWIVGLIVVLIILSLMFGGFQMGSKAGSAGVIAPLHFGAVTAGWLR
jgi:hypothetical protein